MKTLNAKFPILKFSAVIVILAMTVKFGIAFAEDDEAPTDKMSLTTHSSLIQKLEASLSGRSGLTKNSTLHRRLADLYAERARLQQMEEIKAGCTTVQCSKSKQDRVNAIKHYEVALTDAQGSGRSTMMIQKAFLHEGLEQNTQARKLYDQIVNEGQRKHQPGIVGSAYAGRAELQYRKAEFNSAYRDYQKALSIDNTPNKGQIHYRMGWSKLNTGDLKNAKKHLETVLSNRDQYNIDTSFHEDMSRDLASFYARGDIGPREIETLKRLAPEGQQTTILRHLAEETDRLGNKKASIYVWGLIPVNESSPFDKAEKLLQMARLHYESGQKEQAASEMKQASQLWKGQDCQKDNTEKCQTLKNQIRDFVINWNKGAKVDPDKYLLSAYLSYSAIFPNDYEMHYWAGQLARELKNYPQAADSFRNAAMTGKSNPKIITGALLNQIEVAETSNDKGLKIRSYQDYLDLLPEGPHAFKIKYQIAHIKYDEKHYDDAAKRFYELGLSNQSTPENKSLQTQAADLALDALAALKDDERLEQWAQKLAETIPSKRAEYYSIARKASLNLIAALLTIGGPGEIRRAHEKIKTFPLAGISSEEKLAFYKNVMVLGEKSKDITLVREGAMQLQKVAKTPQDRELALSRLVWSYEMELNFAQALRVAKIAGFPELKNDQRALKLAFLSEFAGANPKQYYTEALTLCKDAKQVAHIRQKLIRRAANPWAELKTHRAHLIRFPEVYSESLFETYARKPNKQLVAQELKNRAVLNSINGQRLARILDVDRLTEVSRDIARHRLQTSSQQRLAQTLTQRIKLIESLDKELSKASDHQDWSRQVLVISMIHRENVRLSNEIARFPVPTNLRSEQRKLYREQLKLQSDKYLTIANQADEKLKEFFSDRQALKTLENMYINSDYPYKSLVRGELMVLHKSTIPAGKERIASILGESKDVPTSADLKEAKDRVRSEPFNTRHLANYKEMVEQVGQHEFATYLGARLEKLNSQGTRL